MTTIDDRQLGCKPLPWHLGGPITEADIENARSPRGGWTRETLRQWGVPWPPPKGWKRALLNSEMIPPRGLPGRGPLTEAQEARVREIITEMTGAV